MFNCDVSSVVSAIEADDREYLINKNIFEQESISSSPESVTGKRKTFREKL